MTPHQVFQPFHCYCSSPNLARPGEKISLSNPLALPVVRGSHRLSRRRQATDPRGCRSTLPPRGSSALCTADLPAFAECPEHIKTSVAAFASVTVAHSLSTAHVKTSFVPGCTLTTKFSVRRAQDTNSLRVFFSGGGLPRPLVSTKVGMARAGFVAATTAPSTVCARDCGKFVKARTKPCC